MTDKNYLNLVQQDKIITKLIFIYLNYGILFPKNIFFNKFWYFSKFNFENYQNTHNMKYYRIVNFKNRSMGIDSHYAVRSQVKNTYFTKIWIMRYQNWLIINYYCYFPKIKSKAAYFFGKKKNIPFLLNDVKKDFLFLKRAKLLMIFFFNKNFCKDNYYIF